MNSRRGWRAVAWAVGLVACGVAVGLAWRHGLWGSMAGALAVAVWLVALVWRLSARREAAPASTGDTPRGDMVANGLVLEAAPTPMVMVDGGQARVLNRAARRLFDAEDRIVPAPAALVDAATPYLRHEGRQYRVDRVLLGGTGTGRLIAALIDVEQEERAAEARATAEMIHVLGHELMNGLAPIVSLAESGQAALDQPRLDTDLLRELLGTLARRTESLHRFTEAYRELARLPAPRRTLVRVAGMVDDLARLFVGRWPATVLLTEVADSSCWLDRDQLHQAIWALLQNAAEAATAAGDPAARVTLTVRLVPDEMVVEVRDSGAGIDPAQVPRIFRPFHTTKPDGTGIGLSVARQVALAHRGSLSLVPGLPTTFRLTVPLATEQGSPARAGG